MTRVPTIQAITDRSARSNDLVGAGEVLDMQFDTTRKGLSLRAAKLLHLLIKEAGSKAVDDVEHRVPVAALNTSMHLTLDEFISTVKELMFVQLGLRALNERTGLPELYFDPLIHSVSRTDSEEDSAMVGYRLSNTLRRVMKDSVHWAILSRQAVMAFESRYALRLYELVSLRINLTRSTEKFSIDSLREKLGVPAGKLMKWDAFNRKALGPAIAEVNQLSGFTVSALPYKSGRSVAGVTLTWGIAPTPERVKVQRELESSRVGRAVRRDQGSDKVVDLLSMPPQNGETSYFPRQGSIIYSKWAEVARNSLPQQDRPDVDLVAERFRDFCSRKAILLSSSKIETIFTSFCKSWRPED
ncbi:MAG: hypothetical protein B7Z58_17215 [Acidiphilium sp. 37-64-53]|uniref:Replication initiation protein n=2 Tax=Acidiphilium TaxID=522 RepID=A0AAW9DJV5_ACIAO|nr:replication initiation protein [Acidiphilium acidophilum]MDX5929309.1 replication initiation protein [Acidiphilium acidophilum]OYV99937.1 MAG: hypothetical protein B7Z58_17215 [Acidiphilium sp. 37-64-53]HQT89977.1 replication initiation protein [Acidiphilium sp.]